MTHKASPRQGTGGQNLSKVAGNDLNQHNRNAGYKHGKDLVRSPSGALLEWVEAHRDKHGWHVGCWEVVERPLSVGARARSVPVAVDADVAKQLVSSPEFAFVWEVAKNLAPLPPRLARADMASAWESISAIVDPLLVVETTSMIREAALERYVDSNTVARSVGRLLDDVDREVSS